MTQAKATTNIQSWLYERLAQETSSLIQLTAQQAGSEGRHVRHRQLQALQGSAEVELALAAGHITTAQPGAFHLEICQQSLPCFDQKHSELQPSPSTQDRPILPRRLLISVHLASLCCNFMSMQFQLVAHHQTVFISTGLYMIPRADSSSSSECF